MTSIAVIGPGAIGGTLAGWLSQVPDNEMTLCVRTPIDRLVVEVPDGSVVEATPRVLVDPDAAKPVDWVLAVTKTYDTQSAARWIERLLGPTTSVAVVQNGVEHMDRFADLVPRERTLPVIVDIPAERSAPGRIKQRRHGDVIAPAGDLGARFARLFEGTQLAVTLTDDFLSAAWRKLALNSAGVVNALTRKPAGIARNEKVAALMRAIAAETVEVGNAVGAKLPDTLPDEVVARYLASAPDSVNSLLADRLANRPMELDARNGIVVRLGARHGIATPLNGMAVAILEAS
ncbi:MAG: 2-dehydropantoate 2-reductase [Labilithrix sp.]|nr:2-dehydropantoate 2-reductase [Labilithrix sp.]